MSDKTLDAIDYRFLPGLESTYTREIRAHVLHHSTSARFRNRRTKSKTGRKKDDNKVAAQRAPLSSEPSPSSRRLAQDLQNFDDKVDFVQGKAASSLEVVRRGQYYSHLSQTITFPTLFDPLDSLPLPKFRDRYFLVHNYLYTLVSTYYHTHGRSRWNPNQYLFQEGHMDEAFLLIALTVSARHHEKLHGKSNQNSLKYETKALEVLNRRVNVDRDFDRIGTIVSILGFIALDLEFPREYENGDSEMRLAAHIRGLRTIIALKGGVQVLAAIPFFDWIFHWLDICSCGELSAGMTPLSVHAFSASSQLMIPGCDVGLSSPFYQEFLPSIKELTGFYDDIYSLAKSGKADGIRPAFQPGSIFHNLLENRPNRVKHGFKLSLGSLVYLNSLVWTLRDDPATLESRIQDFRYAFVDEGVDLHASEFVTMWVLLTDRKTSRIANHDLAWLVARVLRIVNRCDPEFQRRVKLSLLNILMANELAAPYVAWTPAQFKTDLLSHFSPDASAVFSSPIDSPDE